LLKLYKVNAMWIFRVRPPCLLKLFQWFSIKCPTHGVYTKDMERT
jgi:hypothetical protein